jgi:hypothetical protein
MQKPTCRSLHAGVMEAAMPRHNHLHVAPLNPSPLVSLLLRKGAAKRCRRYPGCPPAGALAG